MRLLLSRTTLALFATAVLGACGSQAAQEPQNTMGAPTGAASAAAPASKSSAPPKPLSTDAETPTGERSKDKDKEKEQRGNTPPGMDRSGGGPASGAIVDPAGVVTK